MKTLVYLLCLSVLAAVLLNGCAWSSMQFSETRGWSDYSLPRNWLRPEQPEEYWHHGGCR